jgi:2',3'-cyclic-nucleotide 2'-phosphodiesterase (5'-nucleotidase family)
MALMQELPMMRPSRRVALVAPVAFALDLLARPARAATTLLRVILVNDIYLMAELKGPDGRTRGGFARLAAVVKAERAKGGNVIFAHAGDTLSPSLMSGLDRGAHIITLTNMVRPDIFVPGNHEFDFGKAVFLQRMTEANFPLYGANLRGPDGQPLPGFKDRSIVTIDGVRIGLTGATFDDSARVSNPGDLNFMPTVATMRNQAEALRREGADFVIAVVHADRRQDLALMDTRAIDLVLSGHDHDLFTEYDGRNAVVESSFDAHYVTIIDVAVDVTVRDGKREVRWWPRFRIIDTATVTPDPEVAAVVAGFEQELTREMDVPLATTAVELDSRGATVRTHEAAIGNVIADAMRASAHADAAIMNGGGIRGGKVYAPGSAITRRDVLAELPFGNRVVAIEVSGATLRQAIENGLSLLPAAAGRFPQVSGLAVEAEVSRPRGHRVTSIKVGGAPLDGGKLYRLAVNDFMARGGDGYAMFTDAPRLLPILDAPLLANEVMVFIRNTGTIRTAAGNRLMLK